VSELQYEVLSESSRIISNDAGLTYLMLAAIAFKTVTVGRHTAIPLLLPTLHGRRGSHFLHAVEGRLSFPSHGPKCPPFSFIYPFRIKAILGAYAQSSTVLTLLKTRFRAAACGLSSRI
jgi:hypothetical protein